MSENSRASMTVIEVGLCDTAKDGEILEAEEAENVGRQVVVGVMEDGERGSDDEEMCRICHLNTQESGRLSGTELIRIGCGCQSALGLAHQDCAEAWFRVKKNRYCEICGKYAKNITGEERDSSFMEEWHEGVPINGNNRDLSETRVTRCCRQFCNFFTVFLIACFIAAWIFHTKIIG